MKLVRLLMPIVISSLSSSCRAGENLDIPFKVEIQGDEVNYSGQINTAGANAFVKAFENRTIVGVRITSAGGDAVEALRMGRLIRDRKLTVTVQKYCISACAQYVFVAGKRKHLDPSSLLIFHNSPGAIEAVLRVSPLASVAPLFSHEAKAEQEFYQSLGIRINLAALAQLLQPVCVVDTKSGLNSDLARYGVAWRFPGFVPTRKQLSDAGITDVQGSFPTSGNLDQWLADAGFKQNYKPLFSPTIHLERLSPWRKSVQLCAGNAEK